MAKTTVIIDERPTDNKGWYNLKHDGKDIGLNIASNPITTQKIKEGAISIDVNLVEKNGKWYAWDIKEESNKGGGFKANPEKLALDLEKLKIDIEQRKLEPLKQRMIIAQSCLSSACNMYSQGSKTPEQIMETAKKFYDWVIETSK